MRRQSVHKTNNRARLIFGCCVLIGITWVTFLSCGNDESSMSLEDLLANHYGKGDSLEDMCNLLELPADCDPCAGNETKGLKPLYKNGKCEQATWGDMWTLCKKTDAEDCIVQTLIEVKSSAPAYTHFDGLAFAEGNLISHAWDSSKKEVVVVSISIGRTKTSGTTIGGDEENEEGIDTDDGASKADTVAAGEADEIAISELGRVTKIKSVYLGGAVDTAQKKYYFLGSNDNNTPFLVALDYSKRTEPTMVELKSAYSLFTGGLTFDNGLLYTYAIDFDADNIVSTRLLSIDPEKGAVKPVLMIKELIGVDSNIVIDVANKKQYFVGLDHVNRKTEEDPISKLVNINYQAEEASRTNLNSTFTYIGGLAFSSSKNRLFSYAWDPADGSKKEVFLSINPQTGVGIKWADIDKIKYVTAGAAFDGEKNTYYFIGNDEQKKTYVGKIEIKDKVEVSKPDETKPDETKPDETKPDETKPPEEFDYTSIPCSAIPAGCCDGDDQVICTAGGVIVKQTCTMGKKCGWTTNPSSSTNGAYLCTKLAEPEEPEQYPHKCSDVKIK